MTGAAGFVGRHVLARLAVSGRSSTCLVRRPDALTVRPAGVRVIAGRLSDQGNLDCCAAGTQAAIHLAGIIAERGSDTFGRVHVDGTAAVIEACRRGGVRRLIHMSALGVQPDQTTFPSEYFRTKAAAERLVRDSGLDWTIIRPSLIHGADSPFMAMLARFATGLMPMVMLGPGRALTQPIWVDDVARVIVACLDLPGAIGSTYELGGPTRLTWNQVCDTVSRVLVGRRRRTLHVPVWLAMALARMFRLWPGGGPFNRDQVAMLQIDNVTDATTVGRAFGFDPVDFEPTLAACRVELLRRACG